MDVCRKTVHFKSCLQTGLWMRWGLLTAGKRADFSPPFGLSGVCRAGQQSPPEGWWAGSWREAGHIKMPQQINAAKGSAVVLYAAWQQQQQHRFKQIYQNWIHDKKIYSLEGQACLKLTADGICKYYIIYVLNIFEARRCPEDEQTYTRSTNQQKGICMQMRLKLCTVMLFPHRKHESEATSQKRHCGWSHSCLMMPPGSCAGLWPTLSLFSVSCITLKCRVCQYVNVLVYFLCVHLMDLRGRLSSSTSLIPITKANSNIWQ